MLPTSSSPKISAVVLARDEADYIEPCLRSLAWADEVLVLLDPESRDATEAIARRLGARIEQRGFASFGALRNAGLELARGDWVLFVDADERVSPGLAAEIRQAVRGGDAGYWIPRRNRILGRWMRGTGWYPDEQLRLLRRARARYDETRLVHEVATVDGPVGRLREPLIHLNYASLSEFWAKQRRYTALAARTRARAGRPRARALLGAPLREFWRRFVTLHGYRDGALGLVLSLALAYFEWETVRQARALTYQAAGEAS
jgi:glycosyltransferase involved in cell wall biosynthesis